MGQRFALPLLLGIVGSAIYGLVDKALVLAVALGHAHARAFGRAEGVVGLVRRGEFAVCSAHRRQQLAPGLGPKRGGDGVERTPTRGAETGALLLHSVATLGLLTVAAASRAVAVVAVANAGARARLIRRLSSHGDAALAARGALEVVAAATAAAHAAGNVRAARVSGHR